MALYHDATAADARTKKAAWDDHAAERHELGRFQQLCRPDIRRLRALGFLRQVEIDTLTGAKSLETVHLDVGVMDKHFLATAIGGYEAKALFINELGNCSASHAWLSFRTVS